MTPAEYESLRNELVSLLAQTLEIPSIADEAQELISQIRLKIQEDQFHIVLSGEFQGGKSTTFNAICDGRELSPMGSGIKTSGCLLEVRSISDPNREETAEITWRTSRELIDGFSDLFISHLQTLNPKRFDSVSAGQLRRLLDLSNPEDSQLLNQAMAIEWELWESNRSGYDSGNKGKLDILRSASLILAYHDHPVVKRYQSRQEFSPNDVARMVVFPENWEERWERRTAAAFSPDEALFVFIHHVRLNIHSPNLSRLGCIVVDCPGLFASRWDSEIARSAMFDADAILYLFDGSRTIKQSDLKALSFIREHGMEYKLFYGCNVRGLSYDNGRRIMESSMTSLRQNRFSIPSGDAVIFHALLSLRAVQLEQRLEKTSEADGELCQEIFQYIKMLDPEMPENPFNPAAPFIRLAKNASGFLTLMDTVEQAVVAKKARSILIENGARMVSHALLGMEGALQSREASALQDEKALRMHEDAADRVLRQFRNDSLRIISQLDDDTPDRLLADQIWRRLESCRDELLERITLRIYHDVLTVKHIPALLLDKKRLEQQITGIIQQEIEDRCNAVISGWMAEIKDGRNNIYTTWMVDRIRKLSMELQELWQQSGLPQMDLLQGITLSEFSGNFVIDSEKLIRELEAHADFKGIIDQAFLTAGSYTGVFAATSGMLIAAVNMMARFLRAMIASAAVILVNLIFLCLTRGFLKDSITDEIRCKLSPMLIVWFDRMRESIHHEFRKFASGIRHTYQQAFLAAAEKPRSLFESRKQKAEDDLKQTRSKRLLIAREAKKIRETQIAPLRMKLETFVRRVENQL